MSGPDDPEIRIERVLPDDWESYRDIRLEMLLDAPDAFWFTHADEVGHTEEEWRSQVERAWLISAHLDGEVVGSAGLGTSAEPGLEERPFLWGMYVSPRARGKAVGERLVCAVLDEARGRGLSEVFLQVTSANAAAVALYERCGFIPTGRTEPHPRRSDLVEIDMVRRLDR